MSRPKIFASDEEWYVSWWVDALIAGGYVESVEYQPESFELYDGLYRDHVIPMKRVEDKIESQAILQPHVYTCDARIVWKDKADGVFYFHEGMYGVKKPKNLLYAGLEHEGMVTYLEVKPSFDRHNMTRLAVINIKWVHAIHKVVVEIVKPDSLFKTTFVPDRYLLTNKSFKPREIKYEKRSLRRFVSELQESKED